MIDPKDCETCAELETSKADLREVGKHYIESHQDYLDILKAALTIFQAQQISDG